jgi:hypothetical protein
MISMNLIYGIGIGLVSLAVLEFLFILWLLSPDKNLPKDTTGR